MPESAFEIDKYVECIAKHPSGMTQKSIWHRHRVDGAAMAFDAARGWLRPAKDIHMMPRPPSAPLPFWHIIGPETRCDISWRAEARLLSVYTLSCVTFAAVGLGALWAQRIGALEACSLGAVGLTSFQADFTFLGVDHHWRTADTLLATSIIIYYLVDALRDPRMFSIAALATLAWSLQCFGRSQCARSFVERARWHMLWHFGVQGALMLYLFGARPAAQTCFERIGPMSA